MVTPFIQSIFDTPLDATTKGVPLAARSIKLSDIGKQGWNVLRGDMLLPLLIMRDDHLKGNLELLKRFADHHGVSLAPHGKSSFCPQLYLEQIDIGGSWGITAATIHQAAVVAASGVRNILIANEVIGRANVEQFVELRHAFPDTNFYSLVDSPETMHELQRFGAARLREGERFSILLEVGVPGGRAGVRDFKQAAALIDRIVAQKSIFDFAGIECYEGLVAKENYEATMAEVDRLLALTVDVLIHARACNAFDGRDEVILTAGGSAYFDRVVHHFKRVQDMGGLRIILRGGSSLTYDHGFYQTHLADMDRRQGFTTDAGATSALAGFRPALEIMAGVVSLQDEGIAILNMGIRDLPYDLGYPVPLRLYRDGRLKADLQGASGWSIAKANDQHAYLHYPKGADIAVADLLAFGISHPCTAFDKWKVLYRTDGDFNVTGALKTFF